MAKAKRNILLRRTMKKAIRKRVALWECERCKGLHRRFPRQKPETIGLEVHFLQEDGGHHCPRCGEGDDVFAVSSLKCNTCGQEPFEAEMDNAMEGGSCSHGSFYNPCRGTWKKIPLPKITWPAEEGTK